MQFTNQYRTVRITKRGDLFFFSSFQERGEKKTNRLRLWVCLFSLMISSRRRFSGDKDRFSGFSEERLMIDR